MPGTGELPSAADSSHGNELRPVGGRLPVKPRAKYDGGVRAFQIVGPGALGAEPEMLNGVRIRGPAVGARRLAETKQLSFAMIEFGVASRIGTLGNHDHPSLLLPVDFEEFTCRGYPRPRLLAATR